MEKGSSRGEAAGKGLSLPWVAPHHSACGRRLLFVAACAPHILHTATRVGNVLVRTAVGWRAVCGRPGGPGGKLGMKAFVRFILSVLVGFVVYEHFAGSLHRAERHSLRINHSTLRS